MDFSYYNNNKQLKTFSLNVYDKWIDIAKDSSILTSIFSKIDDGDNIVEEMEIKLFKHILDKANELVNNTSDIINIAGLKSIKNKLDNGKLNVQSLEMELSEKYDDEFYSLEAIQKRYPSDKFNIEQPFEGRIVVSDKSTNKWLLVVDEKDLISIRDSKNNRIYINYDDETGELRSLDKNENIAKKINAEITAKGRFGLPTTGENLLKYIKELNPDNILDVLEFYKKNFSETIENAINEEWGLDNKTKKEILDHIEKTLEKAYGFKANYKVESTKVSNEYYEGDEFSVETNGNKMTIINKNNNQKYHLDLDILTKNLPIEERVKLKTIIQKLPAEVLVDLSMEMENSIKEMSDEEIENNPILQGFYRPTNEITLKFNNIKIDLTLIHELGHALDYTGLLRNTSSIIRNEDFNRIYQEEMDNFKKKYNSYNTDNYRYSGSEYESFGASNYATYSTGEMFAECYTLLMSGHCSSKDLILDYFPKTLEIVKEHLKQIRTLPDGIRRGLL